VAQSCNIRSQLSGEDTLAATDSKATNYMCLKNEMAPATFALLTERATGGSGASSGLAPNTQMGISTHAIISHPPLGSSQSLNVLQLKCVI
jgi:hypothetical protein